MANHNRLFGMLDLISDQDDYGFAIGLRTGNDRTMALQLVAGLGGSELEKRLPADANPATPAGAVRIASVCVVFGGFSFLSLIDCSPWEIQAPIFKSGLQLMNDSRISRRSFIKAMGMAAASGGLVVGCAGRPPRVNQHTDGPLMPAASSKLMPVKVSPDRVLRHVAGLRPYRPSGFVVKSEKLGPKTVIHNYGHGGAGVTLSWGTAHLALEEALRTGQTRYAVIGCGAVGLATARLLQRKGYQVTIYAKDLPPDTTSNVAGALWFPTTVYERGRLAPEFRNQFEHACRFSYRFFQSMVGAGYGVRWRAVYNLRETPPIDDIAMGAPDFIRDLFPETRTHRDPTRFFGAAYAQQYYAMMIEPHIYLNAVLRDFQIAGGKLTVQGFANREEVLSLPEPVIMNCTGLGAKDLFQDNELKPIKGQLTVLLPQPEIDYCLMANYQGTLYMFPRSDGILLGGTFEEDVWSLEPNQEEIQRILEGHAKIFQAVKPA